MGLKVAPIEKVKIGLIGCGDRGLGLLYQFNALCPEMAEITAICDVRENMINRSLEYLKKNGNEKPKTYTGNLTIWKKMVERDDLDLIIVATPWEDHVPMSVYAMEHGKHVGVEVPAAYTLEDCWKLVDTAEATQRNCMMLENVCYGDEELWLLNMAQAGVFGTLTYAEAAYIHDLRSGLFNKATFNNWRMKHHVERDGNLYATHGLGPVAQYMDIQRSDKFDFLVSMSSSQAALSEYAQTVDKDNEFYGKTNFAHGDMNNSLIKTNKGRSILVQHDVVTPRPYDRKNVLAGTKAYHQGYPSKISLDGKGHHFLNRTEYKELRAKYRHPIWNQLQEKIDMHKGGHGGMDFVMAYRLIECFNKGWSLDIDVYDGVAWSVVGPLSKISVELGSIPVKFPDFTRGKWKNYRELGIIKNV
ncbi:Gfo/Idh/MocA family oxidoreductase [Aureibaculum sp. 2210JD6-5]|uniref:Gfo/Idh/MocA family protein n=1 Tax=Aureibaculum sp. 2210JD6-5 TaxID=3103957 RepID=UPI002AACBDEF|nr:Gfo/Idh/MocA family oxidoreductase [Aureibaculum sp. 2210JD6-5]MDY7395006.1 Gfo/Idh/MocA family oxidoreductase [Aureibaculum sp. 2210JD6-5]